MYMKVICVKAVSYTHLSRLKGWYKYKAGERFYENGGYTDRKDCIDVHHIFTVGRCV